MKTYIHFAGLSLLVLLLPWQGAAAVELDAKGRELAGLKTATLEKIEIPPQANVYATVISPSPLVDLFRQIEAAEAAIQLSKDTQDRAEKLFASGELVARKDVEAARGQLIQDQAKKTALEDALTLEWGPHFSAMKVADQQALTRKLLDRTAALVRLAVPKGKWLEEQPDAAQLAPPGKGEPLRSTTILPATAADSQFQAQTFLGIFEAEKPLPPPNTTLTGFVETPGEKEEGWLLPASAVVIFQGRAWIYRQAPEGDFDRVEVPLVRPAPGGWFIAQDRLEAGEVVTAGAQTLLSKEALKDAPESGD